MAKRSRKAGAVIVAAGSGSRFGGRTPKQFVPLLGKPMLLRTLEAITSASGIGKVIVVVSSRFVPRVRGLIAGAGLLDVCRVVSGGRKRQSSVYNGLRAFDPPPDVVLIHDGARPLVSRRIIDGVLRLSERHRAVIAALPVTDTLKKEKRPGMLTQTMSREGLWMAQTPQAFDYQLLLKAHQLARKRKLSSTDDAALVERMRIPVKVFPGSLHNIKITTRADLSDAEMWLKSRKTR